MSGPVLEVRVTAPVDALVRRQVHTRLVNLNSVDTLIDTLTESQRFMNVG